MVSWEREVLTRAHRAPSVLPAAGCPHVDPSEPPHAHRLVLIRAPTPQTARMLPASECLESVIAVLRAEAQAVTGLVELARVQHEAIEKACALIRSRCGDGKPGRLVATGVGKAGLIARKLSATFASTGTPSFF